jgi:hypothetical protein
MRHADRTILFLMRPMPVFAARGLIRAICACPVPGARAFRVAFAILQLRRLGIRGVFGTERQVQARFSDPQHGFAS